VTGQVPIYYNHRNTGRPPDSSNKYTSKYNDVPWTPLYPFGHGLSYTTFRYGTPRISGASMRPGESLRVDVDVTNAGRVAGDEIVQLYIRDDVGSVTRPVMELHGWGEVALRLSVLAGHGNWGEMPALIDDQILSAFAVVAPPDELPAAVLERYRGLADRLGLYIPYVPGQRDAFWKKFIESADERRG
jgi:hypothetical protein